MSIHIYNQFLEFLRLEKCASMGRLRKSETSDHSKNVDEYTIEEEGDGGAMDDGSKEQEITSMQSLRSRLNSGPFHIFMDALAYPGKPQHKAEETVISSYLVWKMQNDQRKGNFLQKYYEELNSVISVNNIPNNETLGEDVSSCSTMNTIDYNSLSFKPWYMEMISGYKIKRVQITPYFYWLGWYLKKYATPELLRKDSLEIALELGEKWNVMEQDAKQVWVDVVSSKLRHRPRRRNKDMSLPSWYLGKFH